MPTYEYRCKDCGNEFDAVQSFTDESLVECPTCGGALRKVFGNVGITFKGSGFYKTDSRVSSKSERSDKTSEGDGSSSKEAAKSDTSTGDAKKSGSADSGSSGSGGTKDTGGSEGGTKKDTSTKKPAAKTGS